MGERGRKQARKALSILKKAACIIAIFDMILTIHDSRNIGRFFLLLTMSSTFDIIPDTIVGDYCQKESNTGEGVCLTYSQMMENGQPSSPFGMSGGGGSSSTGRSKRGFPKTNTNANSEAEGADLPSYLKNSFSIQRSPEIFKGFVMSWKSTFDPSRTEPNISFSFDEDEVSRKAIVEAKRKPRPQQEQNKYQYHQQRQTTTTTETPPLLVHSHWHFHPQSQEEPQKQQHQMQEDGSLFIRSESQGNRRGLSDVEDKDEGESSLTAFERLGPNEEEETPSSPLNTSIKTRLRELDRDFNNEKQHSFPGSSEESDASMKTEGDSDMMKRTDTLRNGDIPKHIHLSSMTSFPPPPSHNPSPSTDKISSAQKRQRDVQESGPGKEFEKNERKNDLSSLKKFNSSPAGSYRPIAIQTELKPKIRREGENEDPQAPTLLTTVITPEPVRDGNTHSKPLPFVRTQQQPGHQTNNYPGNLKQRKGESRENGACSYHRLGENCNPGGESDAVVKGREDEKRHYADQVALKKMILFLQQEMFAQWPFLLETARSLINPAKKFGNLSEVEQLGSVQAGGIKMHIELKPFGPEPSFGDVVEKRVKATQQILFDSPWLTIIQLYSKLSGNYIKIFAVISIYTWIWGTVLALMLLLGTLAEDQVTIHIWIIFQILYSLLFFMVDDWIHTNIKPWRSSVSVWLSIIHSLYKPLATWLVVMQWSEIKKLVSFDTNEGGGGGGDRPCLNKAKMKLSSPSSSSFSPNSPSPSFSITQGTKDSTIVDISITDIATPTFEKESNTEAALMLAVAALRSSSNKEGKNKEPIIIARRESVNNGMERASKTLYCKADMDDSDEPDDESEEDEDGDYEDDREDETEEEEGASSNNNKDVEKGGESSTTSKQILTDSMSTRASRIGYVITQ